MTCLPTNNYTSGDKQRCPILLFFAWACSVRPQAAVAMSHLVIKVSSMTKLSLQVATKISSSRKACASLTFRKVPLNLHRDYHQEGKRARAHTKVYLTRMGCFKKDTRIMTLSFISYSQIVPEIWSRHKKLNLESDIFKEKVRKVLPSNMSFYSFFLAYYQSKVCDKKIRPMLFQKLTSQVKSKLFKIFIKLPQNFVIF